MADKEKAEHVKLMEKVKARSDEATEVIDTVEVDKGAMFLKALKNQLADPKTGRIKYSLLNGDKYGDFYHHKVSDDYTKQVKEKITAQKKDDAKVSDSELELQAGGVYGEMKSELMRNFAKYGSGMNYKRFRAMSDEHVKTLQQKLYSTIGDHLKGADIPSILKEIGADKLLKEKDLSLFSNPIYRDDIVQLISSYYQSGNTLTKEHIQGTSLLSTKLGKDPKYVDMYSEDAKRKAA